MGRQKKDSKPINLNLDRQLVEQLEQYCEEVGQTKTTALERILRRFLEEYYEKERNKRQDTNN